MKIEKVNDNQIRCTLTREDLASREIKISELAYGTEKAKSLFRDMMQQANYEFGFEAEDIPLMIEAIPLNAECIVLIITKVEDPEELDTRFSRFAPASGDSDEEYEEYEESQDAPEEVMDLFRRLHEGRKAPQEAVTREDAPASGTVAGASRIYRLDNMQTIFAAAKQTADYFEGESALYKEESTGKYLLCLSQEDMDANAFNKVCYMMSEFGQLCKNRSMNRYYLEEHYEPLIGSKALQSLAGR